MFDIDASGELSPEELVGMVRVIIANNPAMAEYAQSEGAIGKLVEEVFQVHLQKVFIVIMQRK